MQRGLKCVAVLAILGLAEVLSLGCREAKAQFVVGGGFFGPRYFRRGYGAVYFGGVYPPPVVVAPPPVVVARPVVVQPTIVQRSVVVQPAPIIERQIIQPAPLVRTRVIQPYTYGYAPPPY